MGRKALHFTNTSHLNLDGHMQVILISGDGAGAGKTFAASRFADETYSLASQIRRELKQLYPAYDWHNKTQGYKEHTRVPEQGGKTLRAVMLEYGQQKCAIDPLHWAKLLAEGLESVRHIADGKKRIAIDDVRKICELDYLGSRFPGFLHIHVTNVDAEYEPLFDAERLAQRAHYRVRWK